MAMMVREGTAMEGKGGGVLLWCKLPLQLSTHFNFVIQSLMSFPTYRILPLSTLCSSYSLVFRNQLRRFFHISSSLLWYADIKRFWLSPVCLHSYLGLLHGCQYSVTLLLNLYKLQCFPLF